MALDTPSSDLAKSESSSFYTFDNDSKTPKVFTSNLPSPLGSDQQCFKLPVKETTYDLSEMGRLLTEKILNNEHTKSISHVESKGSYTSNDIIPRNLFNTESGAKPSPLNKENEAIPSLKSTGPTFIVKPNHT